jgi:hypothetical protein
MHRVDCDATRISKLRGTSCEREQQLASPHFEANTAGTTMSGALPHLFILLLLIPMSGHRLQVPLATFPTLVYSSPEVTTTSKDREIQLSIISIRRFRVSSVTSMKRLCAITTRVFALPFDFPSAA